jgi:hypothetical protein
MRDASKGARHRAVKRGALASREECEGQRPLDRYEVFVLGTPSRLRRFARRGEEREEEV